MPKRLILILLFLSPLLKTILISTAVECSLGEAFAQVIIKDEITLEETDNPDSEILNMPFYGEVSGGVNWNGFFWNYLRKVVIEAGGEVQSRVCPIPCSGCSLANPGWVIRNLPMGTVVNVTVYSHCINGQLVEAETRLVNTGLHEYRIEFYNPTYNPPFWSMATTLKFTATTPPGCANAQNQFCTEHGLKVPNVKSKPVEWTNGDPEFCDDYPGTPYRKLIPMAFTNFKKEWLENFNVFACFDKERQKWQFLLDNNNTLNINNSVKICEYNLRRILELKVVDSLDQVPNSYPCDKLLADLNRFKSYGDTKPGSYVFRKLMYQHEMLHINEFQEKLETMKELVYNTKYKDLVDIFECEDFDNPEEAAEEIKEIIEDEWIDDLKKQAWGAMPVVAFQLLEDIDDELKRWLVHQAELLLHQKMYDIIDAWIAEAEKCLERN